MRVLFLIGWLMIPIAFGAWHFGPGQEHIRLDNAAAALKAADKLAAEKDWVAAIEKYDEALKMLPGEQLSQSRRIRLEKSKAQMLAKKLPEAHADLQGLVDELKDEAGVDPKLLADARSTLANAQYYMTWLLRLEGAAKADWEREIDAARQTYRLLAEESETKGAADEAKKHREDLESAIRLARMDIGELQGLPLPSQ